jgi:protein gp37
MSAHSSIEWTDRTWNPITGCSEISPGCANCYAARLTATRLRNHPDYQGLAKIENPGEARFTGDLRFNGDRIEEPIHWKKPSRVFVNSMSDLFHENVNDWWLDQIFAQIVNCPRHTFQILTKRPQRMRTWCDELRRQGVMPLENVWLGVSVENQHFADERIPVLLETSAAVRFISAEPLLGRVDLELAQCSCPMRVPFGVSTRHLLSCRADLRRPDNQRRWAMDWVIVGGESGPNARPMHPEWAVSLRDQCASAGVPFFFKQWGSWLPIVRHGFRPKQRAGTLHELRMHRETDCGEVDELLYHAYPSDANDDHGPYWEMTWAPKHHVSQRYLDGRTWDEFPDQIHEGKKSVIKMEGTMLRAEQ